MESVNPPTTLVQMLVQLDALGFKDAKKNYKLLNKTNGNFEVVKNFLEARAKLHEQIHSLKAQKKIEKKEAKWRQKLEKKAEKKEKKYRKKQEKKMEKGLPKGLPAEVKTVYVDGNNLLFVLDALRSRVLQSRRLEAESILQHLARKWVEKNSSIARCIIIFDNTETSISEDRFSVYSARPKYNTSDEALVDCALASEDKKSVLVFTSDRKLTDDLEDLGVHVWKSKAFFHTVFSSLNENKNLGEIGSLDQLADQFLSENLSALKLTKN